MNVRLIVPRRSDGGHRDRLWRFCEQHWRRALPDAEIVEGHHDDGPFNRSAAINGAAHSMWDVAVIVDADVVVDADQIRAGIRLAVDTEAMVLPFRQRRSVSRRGTEQILHGAGGSWTRWVEETQAWNVSTCVIVPRRLWDDVGGFDERFVGWGGEDEMFHAACMALAGVERVDGDAWHLWHPLSRDRDHRTANYRMVEALARRYIAACDPTADRRHPERMRCADAGPMRQLLAESRDADQVVVVCLTNGVRDTLAKTVHSVEQMVHGPIGRKVVVADGCTPRFDGWDTVTVTGGDFARATSAARDVAIGSGQPWVFFTEDDFTFDEPVDLEAMQAIMVEHAELTQLALLRQAWYEHEKNAGGVFDADPGAFTQRDGYIEHRAFWTQNPHLTRRAFIAEHRWPHVRDSERTFGLNLYRNETLRGGYLGSIDDPPRVTHIGDVRAGVGY